MTTNPRSRNFVFTVNNPQGYAQDQNDLTALLPGSLNDLPNPLTELPESVRYAVCQLEVSSTGTPHFQGLVCLKNPIARSALSRIAFFESAFLEPRRGTFSQAYDYCTKAETRIAGPWEFGERPKQGRRTDLESLATAIQNGLTLSGALRERFATTSRSLGAVRALCEIESERRAEALRLRLNDPSDDLQKRVIVLFGFPGTGKTRYVYDAVGRDDLYRLVIGDGSRKSVWFDGLESQSTLLIDDFFVNLPISYFLQILDRYPMRHQYKGGSMGHLFTTVYVTSNIPPEEWYRNGKVPPRSILALWRRITTVIEFPEEGPRVETPGETYFAPFRGPLEAIKRLRAPPARERGSPISRLKARSRFYED